MVSYQDLPRPVRWLDVFLRLVASAMLFVAFVVIRNVYTSNTVTAYENIPQLQYVTAAEALACIYSGLTAAICVAVRGPLAWWMDKLIAMSDVVTLGLLSSAIGAAMVIIVIINKDNDICRSGKFCEVKSNEKFCGGVTSSVAFSMITAVLYLLLVFLGSHRAPLHLISN